MQETIRQFLKNEFGSSIEIFRISPLSGGDINEVFRVESNVGSICLKKNLAASFPKMFEAEAKGLDLLRENSSFIIPQVIGQFSDETHQYLLMNYIDSGTPSDSFWETFGRNLAELHQSSHSLFGLDHDNYIGSLPQSNQQHNSWTEFYANERIMAQMKIALSKGLIDASFMKKCEILCSKLNQLFPQEPPSLVHGDLWSGNYMSSSEGTPVLIDPAVYYGHREMDFGMMQLFGGFPDIVYDAYREVFPIELQWKERLSLTQLYPLTVHLNLFGGGYARSVQSIVLQFS